MERMHAIREQGFKRRNLCTFPTLKALYRHALSHVKKHRASEFGATWDRIEDMARRPLTEERFLREYLWCVHVAGFSAKVVSAKYDRLLKAHLILDGKGKFYRPTLTELDDPAYSARVYKLIGNRAKFKAIRRTRQMMLEMGWPAFKNKFLSDRSPEQLQGLPFIGPILACHLARNLGNREVCKPDIHLVRLAKRYGFDSVQAMCESLGKPAGKVDLALWYACADHGTK